MIARKMIISTSVRDVVTAAPSATPSAEREDEKAGLDG